MRGMGHKVKNPRRLLTCRGWGLVPVGLFWWVEENLCEQRAFLLLSLPCFTYNFSTSLLACQHFYTRTTPNGGGKI